MVVKGATVFPMAAADYCVFSKPFYEAGVSFMGGCCGTTPDHIRHVAEELKGLVPKPSVQPNHYLLLSSARQTISVSGQDPIRVIGERINPTGKAAFQEELQAGKLNQLKQFAQEQQAMGAAVLDVNVGMPGLDEKTMMLKAVAELAVMSELPLCIDSSHPEVLEAALRFYPGRVLLNSLSGEQEKLKHVLPLIRKYGPAFVALPLDDQGIPESAQGRAEVLETVLAKCDQAGVPRKDAVVDGLVLTVSSSQQAAQTTLETIGYAAGTLGLNTVAGLSNVSFGLPARAFLNSSFLAMASARGLSMVIANPSASMLMETVAGCNVLTGRDPESRLYIERFRDQPLKAAKRSETKPPIAEEGVQAAVIHGEREGILGHVSALLDKGMGAFEIVDRLMIPAIQEVGEKYNNRVFFLPQLIASAETMEKAMGYLTPWLEKTKRAKKGLGLIATVKGDIHDIGKKIVVLMLRNQGYEILDLGKSVDEQTIIDKALETKADFIGLSALMTTTMTEMPKVIQLAKAQGVQAKFIVGGAVVTPQYAREIGADAFALDAGQAVIKVGDMLKQS
jgi:5-methyltetrahydrofolate--homocysteine methyltransferase